MDFKFKLGNLIESSVWKVTFSENKNTFLIIPAQTNHPSFYSDAFPNDIIYFINNPASEYYNNVPGAFECWHDFGSGHIQASRHLNGRGWVAHTANVSRNSYVASDSAVCGKARAKVYDNALVTVCWISNASKVFGHAEIPSSSIHDGSYMSESTKIKNTTAYADGTIK